MKEILITSSVLIVVILLARKLFRGKEDMPADEIAVL